MTERFTAEACDRKVAPVPSSRISRAVGGSLLQDSEIRTRIRPSWNCEAMLIRGPLTDRKIEQYRKRGFYSEELKATRRDFQAKKKAKREARDKSNQNFIERDGRLVFSPL